jgi:hypothetical protein
MIKASILILITVTAGLGVYMGLRYLRGLRNRPGVTATHFLLAALSLEPLVIGLRGGIGGAAAKPSLFGVLAAALIALALLSGVTAVMIGRKSRQTANIALGTHAGIAATGYLLLWAWALNL